MNLTYRTATPEDKEQLKVLRNRSYEEYKAVLTNEHRHTLHTNLNDDTSLSAVIAMAANVFVAEADGQIVGMAYLIPSGNATHIYPNDWSYIRMLGVHPDHRGQGIARKLTQLCIDAAKALGEKTIGLHTSEMMDGARHLYGTMGFEQVREIDPIFGKRYWLYALQLGS